MLHHKKSLEFVGKSKNGPLIRAIESPMVLLSAEQPCIETLHSKIMARGCVHLPLVKYSYSKEVGKGAFVVYGSFGAGRLLSVGQKVGSFISPKWFLANGRPNLWFEFRVRRYLIFCAV